MTFTNALEQLEQFIANETRSYRDRNIILFGHFPVAGSYDNTGTRKLPIGVRRSFLTGATMGLLGHVHRGQVLLPNVHYVGSPFQQDFGEAGDTKIGRAHV